MGKACGLAAENCHGGCGKLAALAVEIIGMLWQIAGWQIRRSAVDRRWRLRA
jgi:hypothetical protein